ncbi:class I SAM-dependent methyltransferase [Candidatus Gracilibacteria bacterium]|nr:class I SAM-dependent methyltransferase [Candidatus Gracilibacteria bacterium]
MLDLDKIQHTLKAIEHDSSLEAAQQFKQRAAALDALEFLLAVGNEEHLSTQAFYELQDTAEQLRQRLEAIDDIVFAGLRADIRRGACRGKAFRQCIERYVGSSSGATAVGYDTLDIFCSKLFHSAATPAITTAREPEMIAYQPTPARIVLELLAQVPLTSADVFVDIGAGLGRVPLMVGLLSDARAVGIEIEAAYCHYAQACASDLRLSDVSFFHTDARAADYSAGTVFFLYTPFLGSILNAVLKKLHIEAARRSITIVSYGPCSDQVAQQRWLQASAQQAPHTDRLAVFVSATGSGISSCYVSTLDS